MKTIKLINKWEAAEMLNCSTRTLFRLRNRGMINGYRISNVIKYNYFEIIDYIECNKTKVQNTCGICIPYKLNC